MGAYKESRSSLVQDLINTYDLFLEQPEHLREPDDLRRFLDEHQIGVEGAITQEILEEVRGLREELRLCWTAEAGEEMARQLNQLMGQTMVRVQVEATNDALQTRFKLPPNISLVQRLAFECAMGIVALVEKYGKERMRACAAEPCRDVFIDVSRNKLRRFCSDRCANRYNIAAFRDRQRSGNSES
jgi:predicted RNA-binding Zn ribbon-like protein